MIGIVILMFVVFINTNKSIATTIDSLRISVRSLPDDTIKAIRLADLSQKYLKHQIDTAYVLAINAVRLSKELNYTFGYAYSQKQLGLVYKYMSDFDSSLYYYAESLNLFDSLEINVERASILNRMANIYKRKGDFDNALELFLSSLSISLNVKDSILISAIYNNLSLLYQNMEHYDKALEYQLMNLDINKKSGLMDEVSMSLMNIGTINKEKKDFNQALLYYKQSLELFNDKDNKYDKLLLLHNIGTVYELTQRYDAAQQYYVKAVEIEKEIGNKEMLVLSLQGIGNVLIKTGNFKEGERYLLESYQLAKELGNTLRSSEIALNLYKIYEQQHLYEKSLNYFKLYDDIEDSIYSIENMKQITMLEQKYEAEKKQQQITFLEKEKKVQQLELAKKEAEANQKSFQRNVLILLLLLTFGVVLYYIRTNKKRQKLNQLLIKQNKKITEQRTEIVKQNDALVESNKTKDRLFQIIAHDLRSPLVSMDSITQLIPYWVEEQDYESLKKLSSTLELSLQNVLSLIDNLLNWALSEQGKFPYSPENLNLKENINEAVEVYKPIAEIKNIRLKFSYSKSVVVFADRNMLFTIMRNLLNNAIKFTPENGEIEVGIDSNTQVAKVWIKDSGVGIPKEKQERVFEIANGKEKGTKGEVGKGLGLFFCKEFVNMNNGDIYLESLENKGTIITFTLPLFNIDKN